MARLVVGVMADWDAFLPAVDETPPKAEVQAAAKKFLLEISLATPAEAVGVQEADLQVHSKAPSSLPAKAFAIRAVRAVNLAASARSTLGGQTGGGSSGSGSANALALTMAPLKSVDTKAKMDAAGLQKLPYELQAEQALWEKLASENEAARLRTNKQGFCFVDLTSKEILPLWMAPEEVGGKLSLGDSNQLDGGASTESLRQLSQALKSATECPRFLRSMSQFVACFLKYSYVAVSMNQITWMQVGLHLGVISQLAEKERAQGKPPHAAILYDELLRRQIASRVSRNEVVDLTAVMGSVDKDLWETVQQRLGSVLQAAGLKASIAASSGSGVGQSEADKVLKQQQDGAQAMAKAAENLAAQQKSILDKAAAMAKGAGKGKGGRNGEGSPYKSMKEKKKDEWHDKMSAQRDERKREKDRGW